MSEKTFAKLAEQFDDLAAVLTAISGTFRAAGNGGSKADGDGEAAEPVSTRTRKARATKPAPKEEAGADEDTVREKLKELADAKGAATMKAALAAVGAGRLSEVETDQYDELIAEADRLMAEEEEPAKKPARKGKAPDPVDFDDMAANFKKLVKQDTAAAKALLKANGITKLSEVDQDDDDAMQELNTAINAALDEDEDLV